MADHHTKNPQSFEQSLELYRQLDAEGIDPGLLRHGYPAALINLGAAVEVDDAERSLRLNEEALEVARRIDDPAGVAVALGNIAEHHGRNGAFEEARQRFRESIAEAEELGSAHRLQDAYAQLGMSELAAGEPALAIDAFTRAHQHSERGGLSEYAAMHAAHLAAARHDADDKGEALADFVEHITEALENDDMRRSILRTDWLVQRADMEAARGNAGDAALMLGAARALEEDGVALTWWQFQRRDRVLAAVTEALGEDAVEAAMDRGAALAPDDIVELIIRPI